MRITYYLSTWQYHAVLDEILLLWSPSRGGLAFCDRYQRIQHMACIFAAGRLASC